MEEQRKRHAAEREEQLARSSPYVPGRFVPGSFSVCRRDTYHFDIIADRRPGYVQWYYEKNPNSIAWPMNDGARERAFAIRGEPGRIYIRDERWDRENDLRHRKPLEFPSVESAMAWVSATLLIPGGSPNENTNVLKPCPFCGNDGSGPIEEALHVSHIEDAEHVAYDRYTVQCDKCTATLGYLDSEDEAVAAWNTRTTITDKEVVSVLEEVRRDLLYNAPPSQALRIKVDTLLSHLSRDTDRG